jgi:hypothetical protein
LESQGFKEEALAVTTDSDHKFDLAIELGHIDIALALMQETAEEDKDSTDTMTKWKKLSDSALKVTNWSSVRLLVSQATTSLDCCYCTLPLEILREWRSLRKLRQMVEEPTSRLSLMF